MTNIICPEQVRIVSASWRDPIDPTAFLRVSISRMSPRNLSGYRGYPRLAPGDWWRSIEDPAEWAARYETDVLDKLDPAKVVVDLMAMVPDGRTVALCCWETFEPFSGWCHRGQVAAWLHERLGLMVVEAGDPARRCGRLHPMMARDS